MARRARSTAVAAAFSLAFALHQSVAIAQPKGDRAFGEYLGSECVACHQRTGQYAGIPPIVGWPHESFVEAMNEYRRKKRPNQVMQTIAARLSDEEVAALAAYFFSVGAQQ
jgi:cytochrome c